MENRNNNVKLIRKANDLVEARYKFNIWEMRIFTKMLTMIRRDDEDFKEYRIYIKDMIQEFDLSKGTAYQYLKEGAERLMNKIIRVVRQTDEGMKEFKTPIIAGLDSFLNPNEARYIDISFHPKMKPYLLQLKSQFLTYDVRNILLLPSVYSVRIYELLKQYEKIGYRVFEIDELKDILGVSDRYQLYGHFKKRVIEKAQEDLEQHCDICFTFEETKHGRKVAKIRFLIVPNRPKQEYKPSEYEDDQPEVAPAPQPVDLLYERVKGWQVSRANLESWVNTYGMDQVSEAISITQSGMQAGNIKAPAAYLYKLVQQPGLADQQQQSREAVQERKRKTQESEAQKKALQEQLHLLQSAQYNNEMEIIRGLFEDDGDLKFAVMEQVALSPLSNFNPALPLEENYDRNPVFRSAVNLEIKRRFPQEFELLDQTYQLKIGQLRRRISEA
jgi:plasmid replication initiation protein/NACalpha-BTF3-like transcription factor